MFAVCYTSWQVDKEVCLDMNGKLQLVKCPTCQRDFADQLHPSRGYVYPVHALDANPERRQRLRQCPGSLMPIAREHRIKEVAA